MKKIYLMAAAAAVLAASCTDLDTSSEIHSQYTEYPSSEIAQEAKLADIYYHLRGTLGRRYMEAQALASDEWVGISFGGDYYDSGTYANTCLHNNNADDASIGWYADVAAGITKANQAIKDMGKKSTGSAAARAIRAYYHWILLDSYGQTPILDSIPGENAEVKRDDCNKVVEYIANELEEVLPNLTVDVNDNTYGKPTRYMAEALLAKIYLNWPVYHSATGAPEYNGVNTTATNPKLQRVVQLCDDIISSKKFDLKDPYLSKFYPNNGPQISDFIYAIPFNGANEDGMQYGRPRTWRKANTGTSYYGTTLSKSVGGNFSITPEMSDRLMKLSKDDRQGHVLAGKICMYDPNTYAKKADTYWTYKDAEVTLSKTITLVDQSTLDVGNDVNGYCQGYKSVKWFIVDTDFMHNRNQSNDLPIFRYADVLLMKAEAILRGATATSVADVPNCDTPLQLFNQIRSYVNAPTLTDAPTLDDIYDERAREFFDENWRRNDMIRFGKYESDYGFHKQGFPKANFKPTHRIFPIPTEVLNKNPKWNQNTDY